MLTRVTDTAVAEIVLVGLNEPRPGRTGRWRRYHPLVMGSVHATPTNCISDYHFAGSAIANLKPNASARQLKLADLVPTGNAECRIEI